MLSAVPKTQLKLDFDASLLTQFRTLKQCVAAAVYGCKAGLGGVAAECDVSPSMLSRMLNENENDPRHLPLDFLPLIIRATGDLRPLQWLAAKFIPDDQSRRDAAFACIETMLPQLIAMVAEYKAVK